VEACVFGRPRTRARTHEYFETMGGGASSSRRSGSEGSGSRSSRGVPAVSTPHRAPMPGQGAMPHHHHGHVPVQGNYPAGGPPPHGHAPPRHPGTAAPPNASFLPPMMSYRGELAPAPQIEVREENSRGVPGAWSTPLHAPIYNGAVHTPAESTPHAMAGVSQPQEAQPLPYTPDVPPPFANVITWRRVPVAVHASPARVPAPTPVAYSNLDNMTAQALTGGGGGAGGRGIHPIAMQTLTNALGPDDNADMDAGTHANDPAAGHAADQTRPANEQAFTRNAAEALAAARPEGQPPYLDRQEDGAVDGLPGRPLEYESPSRGPHGEFVAGPTPRHVVPDEDGKEDDDEEEEVQELAEQPPSTPLVHGLHPSTAATLPYGGDLQAAMRAQDRGAIRLIMQAANQRRQQQQQQQQQQQRQRQEEEQEQQEEEEHGGRGQAVQGEAEQQQQRPLIETIAIGGSAAATTPATARVQVQPAATANAQTPLGRSGQIVPGQTPTAAPTAANATVTPVAVSPSEGSDNERGGSPDGSVGSVESMSTGSMASMHGVRVGVEGTLGEEGVVGVMGAPSPLTVDGPRTVGGRGMSSPDNMSVRTLGTEHLDASPRLQTTILSPGIGASDDAVAPGHGEAGGRFAPSPAPSPGMNTIRRANAHAVASAAVGDLVGGIVRQEAEAVARHRELSASIATAHQLNGAAALPSPQRTAPGLTPHGTDGGDEAETFEVVATPIQEQLHELHTALAAALSRTITLRSTIESDIGEPSRGGRAVETPGSAGSGLHLAGIEGCDQLAFTLQQVTQLVENAALSTDRATRERVAANGGGCGVASAASCGPTPRNAEDDACGEAPPFTPVPQPNWVGAE